MIYVNHNDWSKGDLVRVTRSHSLLKGNPDGIWPDILVTPIKTSKNERDTRADIFNDMVVIALDDMPNAGSYAIVRILYNDSVWVANSNYLQPIHLNSERKNNGT
jgi:hypothetical protein